MASDASNAGYPASGPAPPAAPGVAQGQVQQAFAQQADWESVFASLTDHNTVKETYGEMLGKLSATELKVLQVRTLVPLAKASYEKRPAALPGKRSGILNGYRDFAEKKGIPWRAEAAQLKDRGDDVWESERKALRRNIAVPAYYKACYEGPIHSYNRGNGEWMAAFDAPSAYLLVHLHHYPAVSSQEAFDALHEEFDNLALRHLSAAPGRPLRCVDMGCGVGTSTFSTVRSLQKAGRKGKVTGVDLSDYFVAVAQYLQRHKPKEGDVELEFLHGDAIDLRTCGFEDGSLDLVVVSEVTHEMPRPMSEALFREAARVLAPGGVLGYLDLNPSQILKENPVGSLVDRIATSNEPYFDEYLLLDAAAAMRSAGLEVLEETWPHKAKYATLESCSLRMMVAKKPGVLISDSWQGSWELDRRENWPAYLKVLGVPETAWEAASKAPDFHQYAVSKESFFMDHRIPAQNHHLRFTAFFDDQWGPSPYKKPTAKGFDDQGNALPDQNPQWKHRWLEFPVKFETTIADFVGPDKHVRLVRELVSTEEIKMTVTVLSADSSEELVGPCFTWMRRSDCAAPLSQAMELKQRFALEGPWARTLAWRQEAIDRAAALVLENVEAISAAQAADHVSPSNFMGGSMMVRGAVGYYKAMLPSWMEAQKPAETAPPFMQTKGEWLVVPEPKGVGLVIAPWNAPALLCVLPLMGMLAAGNFCVLKPSEAAPATSRLLAKLVAKYFPDRSVVVMEGGKEVVEEIINAPVDHILFTGGGEIAQKILPLAARHLTPVSLELGGKNPCFIDVASSELLATYAAEVLGTKVFFCGQFCQAQDYCLVSDKVFDEFAKILEDKIKALGERRRCRMINATHSCRVRALLKGSEAKTIPPLSAEDLAEEDVVPATLIVEPDFDSLVMKHEIFGPLLPLVRVSGVEEAAAFVRARDKPLVAYCYSPESSAWDTFIGQTMSGNLAVNCGPQRLQSNFNVGFGGVGASGYGYSIWGKEVFNNYSHRKVVFKGETFAGSVWGAAPPPAGPPGTGPPGPAPPAAAGK